LRSIAPNTCVFSDIGPDIRWVGNENGIGGLTDWNYLDTAGFKRGIGAPPNDTLSQGNVNGRKWIPAECDVSIRPGWFYHAGDNDKVKTPQQLFALYLQSVGRGANLLLNVPPDTRGQINERDVAALTEFKRLRDSSFSDNLLKQASAYYEFARKDLSSNNLSIRSLDSTAATYSINLQNFVVQLPQTTKLNCIILREAIHLGQSVRSFKIVLYNNATAIREIKGTTVGNKRILTFPTTQATSFKVYLDDKRGEDNISGVAAYLIGEDLIEK